jgi:hypothetical protein
MVFALFLPLRSLSRTVDMVKRYQKDTAIRSSGGQGERSELGPESRVEERPKGGGRTSSSVWM